MMKPMRILPVLAAAAAMLTAASCDRPSYRLSQWHTLDNGGWAYADTLTFNNDDADTLEVGRIVVGVRHTANYPYSNLWMEMSYDAGDTVPALDTLEVRLADTFGHWYGSGNGSSYQFTDTVTPRRRIVPGTKVHLRHIMRMDTVPELEQIGLTFL